MMEDGKQKMEGVVPNKISFEIPYSDGSGIEFAVRYKAEVSRLGYIPYIEIEGVDDVQFPVEKLDWLIECLTYIKEHTKKTEETPKTTSHPSKFREDFL